MIRAGPTLPSPYMCSPAPPPVVPTHLCPAAGQERCARQLLNARVAADPRDSNTQTPLHLAATVGNVPCVRALLAYGADAAATDSTGSTARALAALSGHRAAELYLLAVESTAAASPGHPTRAELLAGQDQQLDAIYRLACSAKDEASLPGACCAVRAVVWPAVWVGCALGCFCCNSCTKLLWVCSFGL